MNSKIVNIDGHKLHIVIYGKSLFRGNTMTSNKNTANQHYGTMYNKFFATMKNETKPYVKNARIGYIKEWIPSESLFLLDIKDLETRKSLEYLLNDYKDWLNTAFPVVKNKVYRYSEEDTAQIDAKLLSALCQIQTPDGHKIDGYFMEKQRNVITMNNGRDIIGFHSEIGLCRSALRKLRLQRNTMETLKQGRKPVKAPRRGRSGSFNNSIHMSPIKKQTMTSRSLFSNNTRKVSKSIFSNNNSNNNNTKKISNHFSNLF